MSGHTEGKLVARGTVVYFADHAGGFDIYKCPSPHENARRLVACWNACEHIPTDDLERFETIKAAGIASMESALRDRDELLAALRNCAAALRYGMAIIPATDPLYRKVEVTEKAARDLLAKHTKAPA